MTLNTHKRISIESIDISKGIGDVICKDTDEDGMKIVPLKLPPIVLSCLEKIANFAGMDVSTYICDEIIFQFFFEDGFDEELLMSYLLIEFCKAEDALRDIYRANRKERRS